MLGRHDTLVGIGVGIGVGIEIGVADGFLIRCGLMAICGDPYISRCSAHARTCRIWAGILNRVGPMQTIFRSLPLMALSAFCTAGSAQAQSLGLTYGADGRLAAGFTDQVPGASLFFFGDATARVSLDTIPLGFELGVYGLANVVDTPHETYGAFTWDFAAGGRLFLGVARPAYDSFAMSAVDTLFPTLGVLQTATTRSQATYGAMYAGYLPYGFRLEHATDKLRFAVSVDAVPNRDLTIASAGFALPIGEVTLETAIEASWGASHDVSAKVQLMGTLGRIDGGIGLYLPGTAGGPDLLEAFASFKPADKISVAGVVQIPLGSSDHVTGGISARYAISAANGFSAGVTSDAAGDAAYSALFDWTF